MFRLWKSYRLKRAYAGVQSYAIRKKVWGNNIATLIIMNEIINDHYSSLFDVDRLLASKKNTVIHSSFGSLADMNVWLNEVRLVCRESASGVKVDLAGVYAHLNITKQHDVAITDFLIKDGYPVNFNEAFKNMSRIISEIGSYLGAISSNQRQYFDIRLGNGINTLLVFHELLLEVMINE